MNPTLIILFCASLVGILIMLSIRNYELKNNRQIFSIGCRTWADRGLSRFGLAILRILARIKKLAIEKWAVIPHRISLSLARVWAKIRVKVDRYFDRFHRHHVSGKQGPMSSYWKSMHDHKESLPKDKE